MTTNSSYSSGVIDDQIDDIFGEKTFVLCDLCGESIDSKTKQIYDPKIYCPGCLKGITDHILRQDQFK